MASGFETAVDEAKRLERKAVSFSPYKGRGEIASTIDLEPKDYIDLTYPDLLNMYERTEKILSAMGMLTAAAGAAAPGQGAIIAPSARSEEVESKLKEITSESLQKAEEMGKEPLSMAPPPQKTPEEEIQAAGPVEIEKEPAKMEIEFEERAAKETITLEKETEKPKIPEPEKELGPKKPFEMREEEKEIGIEEKPVEEEKRMEESVKAEGIKQEMKPEAPQPAETMAPSGPPSEKRMIMAAVPPALRESPDEAATKRYDKIEEQIMATLGGATDEVTLKKRMLELTKELFKEKSMNRREQIKLEITVLKNMLTHAQEGGMGKRKARKDSAADAHGHVLDTIISSQQAEISQTKDTIIDSYKKQIAQTKSKFYSELSTLDDPLERKGALDRFIFSLTSLLEQLPDVIKRYEDFAAKKHGAELGKLTDSLDEGEKDMKARARERMESIEGGYVSEFGVVKAIIGREIDNLMDAAAVDVLSGAQAFGAKAPAGKDAEIRETVDEINRMDESALLSYLNSKDAGYYKEYEGKQVSKAEAVMKAKALIGKEKGLEKDTIDKYFGLGAM